MNATTLALTAITVVLWGLIPILDKMALAHYAANRADAVKLAGGEPELAARMVVASLILNLDEAITHE